MKHWNRGTNIKLCQNESMAIGNTKDELPLLSTTRNSIFPIWFRNAIYGTCAQVQQKQRNRVLFSVMNVGIRHCGLFLKYFKEWKMRWGKFWEKTSKKKNWKNKTDITKNVASGTEIATLHLTHTGRCLRLLTVLSYPKLIKISINRDIILVYY